MLQMPFLIVDRFLQALPKPTLQCKKINQNGLGIQSPFVYVQVVSPVNSAPGYLNPFSVSMLFFGSAISGIVATTAINWCIFVSKAIFGCEQPRSND
jgi:hypothetical protein